MSNKFSTYDIARGILSVSQYAFLIVGPILLCLFVAMYIKEKFGMGDWVLAIGVLIGVMSSIVSCVDYARKYLKRINKEKSNDKNNI